MINALTNEYHPCQLLADVQTFVEHRGSIQGKTVAWIGDGNNMCSSWINAAIQFDFKLQIATPVGYEPNATLVAEAGKRLSVSNDPIAAATGADLVTTDVFASMGQEAEQEDVHRHQRGHRTGGDGGHVVVGQELPRAGAAQLEEAEQEHQLRQQEDQRQREGGADDLKRIKGVGPKMEKLCNSLGFYHFDQIAAWTGSEVAWVDDNLAGFKGRVTRDNWVDQAKMLAEGGETEFSKRVDKGGVY